MLFPYATKLRATLEEAHPDLIWQLGHLGMPGWTAAQMVTSTDDPLRGLRHKLKQVNNPPVSLVVILAGTNDLGYAAQGEEGASVIAGHLKALHRIAHEQNVTTLAVGIPASRYQQQVPAARELCMRVNERMREWAAATPGASFAPFPSDAVPDPAGGGEEDDFWCVDGLHLTEMGYDALGGALAGAVKEALTLPPP